MKMIKYISIGLLVTFVVGCKTIPKKVPKLIEVSANQIDNQSALIVAEWESAIIAANASKKMLTLIQPLISSIDTTKLSDAEKITINNFNSGVQPTVEQLNNVTAQQESTKVLLDRVRSISAAIRLANSYVANSVDENARIEAVIDSLNKLEKKHEGKN